MTRACLRGSRLPAGPLRASRGMMGLTESMAVGPGASRHYRVAYATFLSWSARAGLGDLSEIKVLDAALVDYLDVLLEEGYPRSEAEYSLCAVKYLTPGLSGRAGDHLPRAEQALRGFRPGFLCRGRAQPPPR